MAYTIEGPLTKGRYFSMAEAARIVGVDPAADEDGFRLAVLRLKNQIEKTSQVVARTMDGGVMILTDVQASDYTARRFGNGVKRLRRLRDVLQFRVDASNMAASEVQLHSQKLMQSVTVVGAIDRALSPAPPAAQVQRSADKAA